MPPKVKFTKDEIVDAALRVARIKGAEGVTTRDIAAELGVSTRPIFTYYRGMDELRADLRLAAHAVYRRYTDEGLRQPIPFLGFGRQYLRFAREEPQLTTIDTQIENISTVIASTLHDIFLKRPVGNNIVLYPELVVRETT